MLLSWLFPELLFINTHCSHKILVIELYSEWQRYLWNEPPAGELKDKIQLHEGKIIICRAYDIKCLLLRLLKTFNYMALLSVIYKVAKLKLFESRFIVSVICLRLNLIFFSLTCKNVVSLFLQEIHTMWAATGKREVRSEYFLFL